MMSHDTNMQVQYQHCNFIFVTAPPLSISINSMYTRSSFQLIHYWWFVSDTCHYIWVIIFLIIHVQFLFRSILIVKFNRMQFVNRAFNYMFCLTWISFFCLYCIITAINQFIYSTQQPFVTWLLFFEYI